MCEACVPHEPVAKGVLMCFRGHQPDGRIVRSRRGANAAPVPQVQEDLPCKRPKFTDHRPEQPEAQVIEGHEGLTVWSLHHGCNDVEEEPSDGEAPEPGMQLPAETDNMQVIAAVAAAASLESARIIAQLPACAVIHVKGVDIVECQRCDHPAQRADVHGHGECSPCCAEMLVCKDCGKEGTETEHCDEGRCMECCSRLGCCKPKRARGPLSAPPTPPRMCGCDPQCTLKYYSSSLSSSSYEAAYWLKCVTRELWINKDLFNQLMQGRFRVGEDAAPAGRYVCESDLWGTNWVDRPSWENRTGKPFMYRVHNRCIADRACSCECAIKRALSDLEMNLDIADGSTPDSASGSAIVTAARASGYGELPFEVVQSSITRAMLHALTATLTQCPK